MTGRIEPYAFQLYRRHQAGESAEEIAEAEGITLDRVNTRLRVARELIRRQEQEIAQAAGTAAVM